VSALRQDRLQVGSDRCHRQEAAVLSALIARPSAIEEVGLLLRPDDFRSPKHAATYASMQALADRSEPIEPLTVAWHARRRCRSLTLAELRALASRPVLGTARAACRALLELRLGEDIAAASTAMVHTSMRLDLSGSEVVALSRTHLAELAGLRARLGATDRYTSTGGRSRATAGQGESPAPERSR
jgi:replicative DNA helicase